MKDKNEIIHFFSRHIREILEQAEVDFEELQEIRLRAYKPFLIRLGGEEYFLSKQGEVLKEPDRAWTVMPKEIRATRPYAMYDYPVAY